MMSGCAALDWREIAIETLAAKGTPMADALAWEIARSGAPDFSAMGNLALADRAAFCACRYPTCYRCRGCGVACCDRCAGPHQACSARLESSSLPFRKPLRWRLLSALGWHA